ncbi:cytidine deaminase-like protein [Baffinella frigidus]|nr:cytidine deaminase-like protein [Cryptophyta sp. CCMP2293]
MLGTSEEDERCMRLAEDEAVAALAEREVPVGCVFVRDGEVIARGHNRTNLELDPTRHAELVAVDALLAEQHQGASQRRLLEGSTLYVTCEPCIMCATALSLLGLKRAVWGCANDKFGGNGSVMDLHAPLPEHMGAGWHGYETVGGVRAEEAVQLFKVFYNRENIRAPVPKRRKGEEGSAADEAPSN